VTTPEIQFDGPCPFLACLIVAPHSHAVCPDCGAVNLGNLACNGCIAHLKRGMAEGAALGTLATVEIWRAPHDDG